MTTYLLDIWSVKMGIYSFIAKNMLEIAPHYVLDENGETIAVQIPIQQFELLLDLATQQQVVIANNPELNRSDTELTQAARIGLESLENGEFDDYDESKLNLFFAQIRQNGRLRCGI